MSSVIRAAVGRPAILNEVKRAEICAYVAAGCSYRTAAQFVGCTVQAICMLAKREAEFAGQLERAVAQREAVLLAHLRESSRRSWRAAAWLLEKTVGGRYGGKDGPRVETLEEEAEREAREMVLAGAGRKMVVGALADAGESEDGESAESGAEKRLDVAVEKLEQAWKEKEGWEEE